MGQQVSPRWGTRVTERAELNRIRQDHGDELNTGRPFVHDFGEQGRFRVANARPYDEDGAVWLLQVQPVDGPPRKGSE